MHHKLNPEAFCTDGFAIGRRAAANPINLGIFKDPSTGLTSITINNSATNKFMHLELSIADTALLKASL